MLPKSKSISRYFYFSPFIAFLLIVFFLHLSSCVTQHDVEYMQDVSKSVKTFNEPLIGDYKLKPDDELFIQINSLDDITANVFSGSGVETAYYLGSIQPYGASLLSYTIDKEGYLVLPVVGRVLVEGKTTTEVSELLKSLLVNVLSQPVVSVKLVNRYVSVLGEVLQPGHYAYAQDKLTIFDAIGLAGDITDYGNRREIVLTRNENGQNIRTLIDLTQLDILASNDYLVRPNDIIYVKPLRRKFWGMRQFPYAVVLSTITTAVLLYSVIQN
jgi:polysaccharide biosynthesis/export protein